MSQVSSASAVRSDSIVSTRFQIEVNPLRSSLRTRNNVSLSESSMIKIRNVFFMRGRGNGHQAAGPARGRPVENALEPDFTSAHCKLNWGVTLVKRRKSTGLGM